MKKHFISIFLIIFLGIVFFKDVILYNKHPLPSDAIIGLYHPYKDFFANEYPRGYPFKNFLITDPLRQTFPWRENAIKEIKDLNLPLWNPYNGAGEPLHANIQSATLYPLNILLFSMPFDVGWSILIFLSPVLAGIFIYLYLINLKISKEASAFGSIAFAFCGFNTTWLEWGTIVHTGLWLPLTLLSIDKLFGYLNNISKLKIQNTKLQLKTKKFYTWSILFIASLASPLLAGHLQTFFYLLLFSILYIFARWVQFGKQKKILLFFAVYYLIFAVVTFVQWAPTLQLINNSARNIDQIWHKEGWFIPFVHLIQFIAPDFFGNPTTGNYWGIWNYGELTGYIGVIPFIFALVAIWTRRDKKTLFFSIITLLALVFAADNFIAKIPYILNIPFISTAQPTRLLFIMDFSLCVLAAFGFDYFVKQKKRIIWPFALAVLLYIFVWAFVILRIPLNSQFIENIATAKRNLILPTIIFLSFIGSVFVLYIFKKWKKASFIFMIFVFLVTSFDVLRFAWKFNSFSQKELLFPKTETIKFLLEKSSDYPWRFLGVDYVKDQKRIFAPNLSSHDRLYTLDTYNPLLLRRYQEFAAISEWGFVDVPEFSFNRSIILNNYESKFIDFMGVKYVASINDLESKKLKLLFKEGETRVYENTNAFPRAFMVYDLLVINNNSDIARKLYDEKTNLKNTAVIEEISDLLIKRGTYKNKVTIDNYSENRIEVGVTTDENGLLVLTDTFYPTWDVYIDGKKEKIYRTNYAFRGVTVKKGTHKVVFINSLL